MTNARKWTVRHKFASEFLQRGGDIASLQAILGHKSIAMTMRYSHIQTDRLHQVIQGLRPKPATEHNTENVPGQG